MSETQQLTLPITGMTCANCVAAVERNLKKLDGVQAAVVNLSSERAAVTFDPVKLGLGDLIARVERAGYGVATGEAELMIRRLADDSDARRLEAALGGALSAGRRRRSCFEVPGALHLSGRYQQPAHSQFGR